MAQPIVEFNACNSCIPCFSHVVNIITQRILKVLDQGVVQDSEFPDLIDADNGDDENDCVVVADDDNDNGGSLHSVILKVRQLVCTICASGQRQELLCSLIIRGNESK